MEQSPASSIEIDLLNNLTEKGVDVTVLCSSLGNKELLNSDLKIIKTQDCKLIMYMISAAGLILSDLKWLPDSSYYSWGINARKKAEYLLKSGDYDCIHSFGFPNACHRIAYKLKLKYKIPWIATFFDSWTDYPTRKFRTKYFKNIDEQMEREIAENADVIVHDNSNIAEIWGERYGSNVMNKIKIIPINFNYSYENKTDLNCNNKEIITISHVGTFYPYRDASIFITSIHKFISKYPNLKNRIKIVFIGKVLNRDIQLIKKLHLNSMFKIVGKISSKECQKYYNEADILLATAGELGEEVMFPSKILKYFYYDRPILGITRDNTILKSELDAAGHFTFTPDSIEELADFYFKAITDYNSICNYQHDYWKKFSVDVCSELYYNNLRKMVDEVTTHAEGAE